MPRHWIQSSHGRRLSWQPWGFDADLFNLFNGFRCSHGQDFITMLRDEHVVLNTNTDATELWCDRVV